MDNSDIWVGDASRPDTYALQALLGGGGEGEVWLAEIALTDTARSKVAVKILPEPDGDSDREKWIQQGHLLRQLAAPGLVHVLDVFVGAPKHRSGQAAVDGRQCRYVVMKYIDGPTLLQWIEENPGAGVSQRLGLLKTPAVALDELHNGAVASLPVAHGDVKPGNIIVDAGGRAVLVDVGLTRLPDGPARPGLTMPFAAPELRDGAAATPQTDRFAFAATVVQLLTDQPPRVGPDGFPDLGAIMNQLHDCPRLAGRVDLISGIRQGLATDPGERPASLHAWLNGLGQVITSVRQDAETRLRQPGDDPGPTTRSATPPASPRDARQQPILQPQPIPPPQPSSQAPRSAPVVGPAAPGGADRRSRRLPLWLVAAAAVVLIAVGVPLGWTLWRQDAGTTPTPGTSPTTTAMVAAPSGSGASSGPASSPSEVSTAAAAAADPGSGGRPAPAPAVPVGQQAAAGNAQNPGQQNQQNQRAAPAAVAPNGPVLSSVAWSLTGDRIWSMDQRVTLGSTPGNTFWYLTWRWPGTGDGAFIGLQTDGDLFGTSTQLAIFSSWGSTGASGPCRVIDSGVRSCRVAYPISAGHTYRFRLWALGQTSSGTTWGAWVMDDSTGVDTHIGNIVVPASGAGQPVGAIQNFRPGSDCSAVPSAAADFAAPGGNGNGDPTAGGQYTVTGSYLSSQQGGCPHGGVARTSGGATVAVGG